MPHRSRSVIAVAVLLLLSSCARDTTTTAPRATPFAGAASVAEAQANVRVNEVESNQGVPGDWVEFHNAGNTAVDLGGYVFRDNDDTRGYTMPAGTVIPAQGFLVLDETQFGFGLGAADAARLFAPGGTQLIDSHTWTAHATLTYGRCPDGSGAFATTTLSTKGATNDCSVQLFINEIEGSGGTPGDWVELYNPGDAPADVSGYVFRDNNDATGYVIPAGTSIAPKGFLVLEEADFGFGIGAADAARLFRPNGTTLVDSHTWTVHASTTYGRCPDGLGGFATTASATKGAANICAAPSSDVKVNEVESNLGAPGDWIELYNAGTQPVDIGGYVVRDNDDTRGYTVPAGTIIPAKAYLVLDEAVLGYGLGAADAARLFAAGGANLVDSYTWTAHASTTYGRCPDGTGAFGTSTTSTKGAPNDCGAVTPPPPAPSFAAWPGDPTVVNSDAGGLFNGNMSGLSYQALPGLSTGVIWAVRNGPGTLFRLTFINGLWTPAATRTWIGGKALRYPNGTGDVDAEGVVAVGNAVYVAAERNNASNAISRNSILRYDVSVESGGTLVATYEWNITADLPANGANLGLEAITRVPDAFLVSRGFFDESKGRAYNPADYPGHDGALFFVGVEATGNVHAYALDHASGAFTRVATVSSGFPGVMDLTFDAELGQLWAICDNTCNGRSTVLRIDALAGSPTLGRFVITQRFERPTGLADLNNEGFTFAPLSECVNGRRPALWADDGETGGIALRRGTVTCSAF
ncbi:MAG: lamin tail domain-containing protein [Gemmatimonadota bacterium]